MQEWLIDNLTDAPFWLQIVILGVGTFISEDLTTILAGVLVSRGTLDPYTALLGCFLGIFIGDGLLYLAGLLIGKPALKLPILRDLLTEEKVNRCAHWFERNGIMVVLISRFLPGTRLPTYFAAGLLGSRARYFLLAAAIATAIWTPLLIGGSWYFGERFHRIFSSENPYYWPALIGVVLFLFGVTRVVFKIADWKYRRRVISRIYRIYRWEFWPVAILYFPVFLYNLLLALRYRRFFLPLLANPGISTSGYIGEPKSEIMASFGDEHGEFLARSTLIPPLSDIEARCQQTLDWMARYDISFPIFLKPDSGQRGDGVKRADGPEAIKTYLTKVTLPVHAQEVAHGPYEFGVFYQRFPDEPKGRILGLTGKEFPRIVGDGKKTVEDLILLHPSGRGRRHIYLERFRERLDDIPEVGETIHLVRTGNHCLGTLFTDNSHLITEAMEQRFDAISQSFPGFYIGRYDVRASDLEAFRAAEAFKIIELNGAAGEPGHMYDAGHGLLFAYKTLFRQYRDLWRIGFLNEKSGAGKASMATLIRAYLDYQRGARTRAQIKRD